MTGALPMILALLVLFLGGAAVGDWLARTFAPGSRLAEAISFFALPAAFAFSLQAWYGLAFLGLVARAVTGRIGRSPSRRAADDPLPGAFVFLLFSSVIAALTGIMVGLLSSGYPAWLVFLVYWFVGTLHGAAGWRLARAGVLVPPESV